VKPLRAEVEDDNEHLGQTEVLVKRQRTVEAEGR
jgi:hypothetical protein